MNRNVTSALINILKNILTNGQTVGSRDQEQTEVLATLTQIEKPTERFLVVPGRNNNVFAQLAETMWVLAGRNDLDFLQNYLPRASDFSDDGKTWRAAYGPRLRKWNGNTDQFEGIIKRLKEDPVTKRAVMNIFDPACDYQESKDIPCNNWLHFIQRNSCLDLNVTVRANDAIWGFSGINFFEWSVLHELVATTMGWRVGTLSWFVGTFHIYNRHYSIASKLARIENPKSMYEYGVRHTNITTALHDLDDVLEIVFEAEKYSKNGNFNKSTEVENKISDKFFFNSVKMLKVFNALKVGVERETIELFVNELDGDDFKIAVIEYLSRRWKCPEYLYEIYKISPEFYSKFKQMQKQQLNQKLVI